jgi:hypothetical protein
LLKIHYILLLTGSLFHSSLLNCWDRHHDVAHDDDDVRPPPQQTEFFVPTLDFDLQSGIKMTNHSVAVVNIRLFDSPFFGCLLFSASLPRLTCFYSTLFPLPRDDVF